MREIGIQFSAPMVQAILSGAKTVTRRTVKGEMPAEAVDAGCIFTQPRTRDHGLWTWLDSSDLEWASTLGKPFRCPYGVPGDRLWVREAWRASLAFELTKPSEITPGTPIAYVAGGGSLPAFKAGKFRPGMFMPRWASRIALEVTDVRVERLQAISEAEARAEGCERVMVAGTIIDRARDQFAGLWESINGAGSWDANPWVWVVGFRRVSS